MWNVPQNHRNGTNHTRRGKIHQPDFVKNIKIKKIQGSVNSTPSASDTGKNRLNFDPRFCVINDGILFKT